MKKNVMMRLAAVMLMCVLLSTSVIGGTFAKYTTKGTSTDTARVAKWGVTIESAGNTMFAKEYDGEINPSVKTINSYGDKNLVAPGTSGSLTPVVIKGTPEVAVDVEYDATVTLTGWKVDGNDYCPIIFTVGYNVNGALVSETTYGMSGTGADQSTYTSYADLAAAVEAAIESYKARYEVNTDMQTTVKVPTVSWEWPFVAEGTNTYSDDVKDTALGNIAIASLPTITLEITTTVTQVD